MFNLFIIGVRDLNGLVIGMLDGLVVGHGLGHFDLLAEGGSVHFLVSTFVGDLLVGDDWLIIGIIFLYWDVFHAGLGAGGP